MEPSSLAPIYTTFLIFVPLNRHVLIDAGAIDLAISR